jgi:hypothetical protein
MSQVLTPRTETTGDGSTSPERTPGRGRRSTVMLVVLLSLLLGAALGWAAYTATTAGPAEIQGADTWGARLEAQAEHHAQLRAEQRRWEAQADRFAPGWRDR